MVRGQLCVSSALRGFWDRAQVNRLCTEVPLSAVPSYQSSFKMILKLKTCLISYKWVMSLSNILSYSILERKETSKIKESKIKPQIILKLTQYYV